MIQISVEPGEPLSGWAGPEDGPAEAFAGWLQLLEILNRLVPVATSAAPAEAQPGRDMARERAPGEGQV